MDVLLHSSAEKVMNSLERKIQENIKSHLKKLSENPYSKSLDIKKLKGLKSESVGPKHLK